MRMSCNGCRVLRKGCSDKCSIKSCLQWIKSPESQANATVFLAKFYGRAGLLNLLNAGPSHLRPGIFRSLLYEACGRIVNPIYGATGLLLAGNWQLCQAAVDAVLSGSPIKQESVDSAASTVCPPLKVCDIRHVSKKVNEAAPAVRATGVRKRMKAGGEKSEKAVSVKPERRMMRRTESPDVDDAARVMWSWCRKEEEIDGSTSRDSGLSQHVNVEPSGLGGEGGGGTGDGGDSGSEGSVEATAAGKVEEGRADDGELELELTLGFEPVLKRRKVQPVDDAMCTRPRV